MKSPNALLTSRVRPSVAIALMMIWPLAFVSCQSASSGYVGNAKESNPYSRYEPKTPEEEAYYRDVYSGDWKEDSKNGFASVYKHGGSVTLPKHWQSMPPGAKTLEEIRFESSQRKMAEMRAMGRPAPTSSPSASLPMTSPVAPHYSSSIQSQQSYPVSSNVPAPPPAPTSVNDYAPTSAPLEQPYAASPVSAPQSNFVDSSQGVYPSYGAQTPPVASHNQPSAQFVAQAPSMSQPQAQYPAATQPVVPTTEQPSAQPAASTPSIYPTPSPSIYPTDNISASVDLFDASEWVVLGQEPDEEDPFADVFADDVFADEPQDESSEIDESAQETSEASVVPTPEEPAVNVTADNVTVKTVSPGAMAAESAAPVAPNRLGGRKLPLLVDPTIAKPYEDVHRPINKSPGSADSTQSRSHYDEYVLSGGDAAAPVISREDWSVDNLDTEDSVAHFDTIDGRILTEPSNRLFLYSPRFGAVRQVVGPIEGDYREAIEIANVHEGAIEGDRIQGVDVRSNEMKALGANSVLQPQGAETTVGVTMSTGLLGAMEADAQIRLGAMLTSESVDNLSSADASLMLDGAIAAQGWSGEQSVAVSTELVNAFSNAYIDGAATVYQIKDDTKTSKLRVIKIANKEAAKPGEFVEFTLRFENIGDQPIGNVTILDNLSARLRYVDGTAQSSVEADFLADLNEKGSLILRWEITEPLYPKEFGVVRFICKVQ
ncbi:MAG: hypothetical protein ACOX0A_05560 [Thermoguttaceae bacterium]|jgi:uncharacterized repeat protein (TIGR01451 family)